MCREKGGLTLSGSSPAGVDEKNITASGYLGSEERRAYLKAHFESKIRPRCEQALAAMLVKTLGSAEYNHMRASGLVPGSAE